jgi:hypothetical protein
MSGSRDDQPNGASGWLPDDASGVLSLARDRRATADRAEADLLQLAVQWAIMHPAESIEDAETIVHRHFGDTGIPVAGSGAPLVAEFSIAEFAAAVGLGTETGKRYVGHAVELRYRLERLWERVVTGDLPAWKARRVADQTLHLSAEAAEHVDRHVAPVAHKIKPSQLDRLLVEAVARFMPAQAEEDRKRAWDQRRFDVNYDAVDMAGTCHLVGEVDLADAIDIDRAVAAEAQHQADLGCTLTLDQRRAVAIGVIARRDLTLEFPTPAQASPDQAAQSVARKRPGRDVVLMVHLSEGAVGGASGQVGRVENTATPISVETIRAWCGHPDANVVVKPVMDLAAHVHVDQYEIDGRISEPVALRDLTCVFPWCTRPARKLHPDEHPADCDHHTAYADGGVTCTCQIAPLCRRHHRLKTHGGWSYTIVEPGTYLWTSSHRYQYLRDHTGTLDVSHDRHRCRPPDPPPDG